MVVFPQGDRKFLISVLTQSAASSVNQPLVLILYRAPLWVSQWEGNRRKGIKCFGKIEIMLSENFPDVDIISHLDLLLTSRFSRRKKFSLPVHLYLFVFFFFPIHTWKDIFRYSCKQFFVGAVVVAQLTARSLPMTEDPGLIPVIGNFYSTFICC